MKSRTFLAIAFGLALNAHAESKLPAKIICTSEQNFEVTSLELEIIGNGPEYRAKIGSYSKINKMAAILKGDYVVSRMEETQHKLGRPLKAVFFADENGSFRLDPKGKGKNSTLFAKFNKADGKFYSEKVKCE